MPNTFRLQIITPERVFLQGDAEALTLKAPDGEIGIAAGRSPVIISTVEGPVHIKQNGQWRTAAASEGTATVTADEVNVMLQTIEWPEEIDARRAQEARERAEEILRQKCSIREYVMAKSMLSRAMVRLRVSRDASHSEG